MSSKSLRKRLEAKKQEIKNKSGGWKYFLIKEGTLRVRHVPVGDERDWSVEAVTFYLGKDLGVLISPATFKGKCAFMDAYNEMSGSKKPSEREIAKRIKPGRKYFSPIVRYKDAQGTEIDKDSGVKLLLMTPGLAQEAIDLYLDEKEAGDFTDPSENGYDLKYVRVGTTKTDTEYTVRQCKPSRLKWKEVAGKQYDPEAMLKELIPTYKETKALLDKFLNLAPEDDDVKPKKKKKKSRDI